MESSAITPTLVSRLVAEQFPHWGHLPVRPVELDGSDNRTFRLGGTMSVRLPSADAYTAQVEKEHRWLPRLGPHLPLPIPTPLAKGVPGSGFPRPWSVYRWLAGESATVARIDGLARFADDLAGFLAALQRIDADDGPAAGPHSFFRGGPLETYDAETRETIALLAGQVGKDAALAVWDDALAARWADQPVWVHGDVVPSNLLVHEGHLSAVIDFGCSAVGDPACDLAIAWTVFEGDSRAVFREGLAVDDGAWARGRGWALWKALLTLARPGAGGRDRTARRFGWRLGPAGVIEDVLSDSG